MGFRFCGLKILLEEIEKDNEIKNLCSYYIIKIRGILIVKFRKRNKWHTLVPIELKLSPIIFELYYYYQIKESLFIMELIVIYDDDMTMIVKKNLKKVLRK